MRTLLRKVKIEIICKGKSQQLTYRISSRPLVCQRLSKRFSILPKMSFPLYWRWNVDRGLDPHKTFKSHPSKILSSILKLESRMSTFSSTLCRYCFRSCSVLLSIINCLCYCQVKKTNVAWRSLPLMMLKGKETPDKVLTPLKSHTACCKQPTGCASSDKNISFCPSGNTSKYLTEMEQRSLL